MGSNGPLEVLFVAKSPQKIYASLFLLKFLQQKSHSYGMPASYCVLSWTLDQPTLAASPIVQQQYRIIGARVWKKRADSVQATCSRPLLSFNHFLWPPTPGAKPFMTSPPLSLFPIFLGVFSFYTSAPVWLMFCSEMWRWWKTDWFKVSFSVLLLRGSYLLPLSSWVASNHIYDRLSTPGQPPHTLLAAAVNFI